MNGLYIHIPFCKKKCIYCNFYSIADSNTKSAYIQALLQEISLQKNYLSNTEINTIYFGGGTPTLLSIPEIELIISKLYSNFNLDNLSEFTIEANPEQVTPDYVKDLKKLGFNRISIGIQSFDDKILQLLGRLHDKNQAETAIINASNANFSNISIDLIYGIAARNNGDWHSELNHLKNFPITHFSAYALTVEENTLLHKKISNHTFSSSDDEQYLKEMNELFLFADDNNFEHYEISNFAKKNFHSLHNSNYWNGNSYLGLGASAHSFNQTSRQWNIANLKSYIESLNKNILPYEIEYLSPTDKYNEYILLHLRTNNGINLNELKSIFDNKKYNYLLQELSKINTEYYTISNESLKLTRKGIIISDDIISTLFL